MHQLQKSFPLNPCKLISLPSVSHKPEKRDVSEKRIESRRNSSPLITIERLRSADVGTVLFALWLCNLPLNGHR